MFQEKVVAWLSRPVPERASNEWFELPAVLTTDIGLHRSENQDRFAALWINQKAHPGGALIAVAVADGMGGMRDGAKCASVTLSSFFSSLISNPSRDIEKKTREAVLFSNRKVFEFASGLGGATLSAIIVDEGLRPFTANLGDSRIYSFGPGVEAQRLTTDDSLAEAFGGHGSELIQFVGMGEGVQPHVLPIPVNVQHLAIMTDGLHFLEAATLNDIFSHAPNLNSAAARLPELARWCGGPDNASAAFLSVPSLIRKIQEGGDTGTQIWDPFGTLALIWMQNKFIKPDGKSYREPYPKYEVRSVAREKPKNPRTTRPRKDKREEIQLEIHIQRPAESDESDDNSK